MSRGQAISSQARRLLRYARNDKCGKVLPSFSAMVGNYQFLWTRFALKQVGWIIPSGLSVDREDRADHLPEN